MAGCPRGASGTKLARNFEFAIYPPKRLNSHAPKRIRFWERFAVQTELPTTARCRWSRGCLCRVFCWFFLGSPSPANNHVNFSRITSMFNPLLENFPVQSWVLYLMRVDWIDISIVRVSIWLFTFDSIHKQMILVRRRAGNFQFFPISDKFIKLIYKMTYLQTEIVQIRI